MHHRLPLVRQEATRALILLVIFIALCPAQGTTPQELRGVVLSEVYSETFQPGALPSYIEVWNRDRTAPVRLTGSRLFAVGAAGVPRTFIFPTGAIIPPGGTAVVAARPIPNVGVPGVTQFVDATFFANQILAPGNLAQVCLDQRDAQGQTIRTDTVPFLTVAPLCPGTSFSFPPVTNRNGFVLRVLRVDSDTARDWYEVPNPIPAPVPPATVPVAPSPGVANPQIARVNGFLFGQANADGLPLAVPLLGPNLTAGNVNILSAPRASSFAAPFLNLVATVRAVLVPTHPDTNNRVIRDPIFDRVLSAGQVITSGRFTGVDPLFAGGAGDPLNWRLEVPSPTAGTPPGILNIDMGPLAEVGANFRFDPAGVGGNGLRVERIFTDNQTDSTANGNGDLTEVQIEVLPDPTGPPGDVWCDTIIYGPTGARYQAKVLNWPPNPSNCSTPVLGLSSPTAGRIDIIALCFNPLESIFILPSLLTSNPLGTGPFLGLFPDAITLSVLSLPLNTDPFYVTTTVDGLYFFALESLPSGFSIDLVAVAFDPMLGFGSFTPPARVFVL